MPYISHLVTALCLSVAVTGCVSSMQVQTDYNPGTDFDDYQEYHWMAPINVTHPSGISDSLLVRQFSYAVDQELTKRGFIQTRGEADFSVVIYGPGEASAGKITWAPGDLMIKSQGNEGIVLEVVDAMANVCVWRGVTDQVFDEVDPEIHQAKVNEAVTRMFDLFPRLPVMDRVGSGTREQP